MHVRSIPKIPTTLNPSGDLGRGTSSSWILVRLMHEIGANLLNLDKPEGFAGWFRVELGGTWGIVKVKNHNPPGWR